MVGSWTLGWVNAGATTATTDVALQIRTACRLGVLLGQATAATEAACIQDSTSHQCGLALQQPPHCCDSCKTWVDKQQPHCWRAQLVSHCCCEGTSKHLEWALAVRLSAVIHMLVDGKMHTARLWATRQDRYRCTLLKYIPALSTTGGNSGAVTSSRDLELQWMPDKPVLQDTTYRAC